MTAALLSAAAVAIGGLAVWATLAPLRLWASRAWRGRRAADSLTCGACTHWRHRSRAWGHCTGPGGWTKLWWACERFESGPTTRGQFDFRDYLPPPSAPPRATTSDAIADAVMQVMRDAPKDRPWGFITAAVWLAPEQDGMALARHSLRFNSGHSLALAAYLLQDAAEAIAKDPNAATLYGRITAALVALEYIVTAQSTEDVA